MNPVRSELADREEHDGDRDQALVLRARERAKSAWSASLREDDRLHRPASERRLAASWPRPRVLPVRAFTMGAAAAACLMLVAFFALRGGGGGGAVVSTTTAAGAAAPTAPAGTSVAASGASDASGASGASLPPAGEVESASRARGIMITGACPDCRIGGAAVEPGVTLGAFGQGRALSVPRGARVTLAFAMAPVGGGSADGATRGLIDPAVGIDVEGPASATSPDEQTVALERGSARFRGLRDVAVAVPGARIESNGATFTVRIDARGVARIAVEKGRLVVTSLVTKTAQEVEAEGVIEVASGDAKAGANAGAKAGAKAGANANANGNAGAGSERAAFTQAEVEMATGERERGRARLAELTRSSDVRLASDAATLLARSEPTPAERAAAWERYLATSPPKAYRDRALLERAEALLDAGRMIEANAILAELRSAPLTEAQQRQLDRLSSKANERR